MYKIRNLHIKQHMPYFQIRWLGLKCIVQLTKALETGEKTIKYHCRVCVTLVTVKLFYAYMSYKEWRHFSNLEAQKEISSRDVRRLWAKGKDLFSLSSADMPYTQGIQLLALLGELTETPEGIAKCTWFGHKSESILARSMFEKTHVMEAYDSLFNKG